MRFLILLFLLFGGMTYAQSLPTKTITDNGQGTGTTTWHNDTIYLLDKGVYVNSGQVLTIEPGTIVKSNPGIEADASFLCVARGGRLIAEGTETEPIIFTAAQDDVSDLNDIPFGTRGLWGGLMVLGNATLNTVPGEQAIEGLPTTEPRAIYGGTDDGDTSGVLKYISIRYAGTDIGAGNEIAGLTLAGAGFGTQVNYIESISGANDGFAFYGGLVGTKHLISAFNADDAFDWDQGFRGKGQFWFGLCDDDAGDRGIEGDGGTDPENGTPLARPLISQITLIGRRTANVERAITFRDNSGGDIYNGVYLNYGQGVDVELLASGDHSYGQWQNSQINLRFNLFWGIAGNSGYDIFNVTPGSGVTVNDSTAAEGAWNNYFALAPNWAMDPGLRNTNYTPMGTLDPRPTPGGLAATSALPFSDPWFDIVFHRGAFGADSADFWASGWSCLSNDGFFSSELDPPVGTPEPLALGLSIYPNPNQGKFRVDFGEQVNGSVLEVVDLSGRVILREAVNAMDRIELALDLSPGLYLIRLSGERSGVRRLVIE